MLRNGIVLHKDNMENGKIKFLSEGDDKELVGFLKNLIQRTQKQKDLDTVCVYYSTKDGDQKMFVNEPADFLRTIGTFELFQQLLAEIVFNDIIPEDEWGIAMVKIVRSVSRDIQIDSSDEDKFMGYFDRLGVTLTEKQKTEFFDMLQQFAEDVVLEDRKKA